MHFFTESGHGFTMYLNPVSLIEYPLINHDYYHTSYSCYYCLTVMQLEDDAVKSQLSRESTYKISGKF